MVKGKKKKSKRYWATPESNRGFFGRYVQWNFEPQRSVLTTRLVTLGYQTTVGDSVCCIHIIYQIQKIPPWAKILHPKPSSVYTEPKPI